MASGVAIISVSVVVTTHNSPQATKRCISAIRQWCGDKVEEIIVVDDGSSPPFSWSEGAFRLIRNEQSRGYASAVNQGIGEARGELVLLLDCDAFLTCDAASIGKRLFEANSDLGIVGFALSDDQGVATGASDVEPRSWSLILGQRLSSKVSMSRIAAHVIHSCAILIRRECFRELNGFDEAFDFLDADIDFSMRVSRSRWKLLAVEPSLTAIHVGGGSPQTVVRRVVRFHRNRYLLLSKHKAMALPSAVRWLTAVRSGCEYIVAKCIHKLTQDPRYDKIADSRREICRYFLIDWRNDKRQS